MRKQGQASLFVIIGIILLLSAGFVIFAATKTIQGSTARENLELEQQALSVQRYIDSCLQQELRGAQELGLTQEAQKKQEEYLSIALKKCTVSPDFRKQGISATAGQPSAQVDIREPVVAAAVTYPVIVRWGNSELAFSMFSHYIKREASATITQDQYGTTTERTIITDDKKAELHIPAETRISFPDSTNTLSLKVVDKSTNGQKNQEVLGELAYLASPSGTTLTPGAQLTLKYNTELSTLPPQTTEEQLNIAVAYYDDTQQR
ncbi:hypothetical protein HY640_00980, partial [Candidatus Woesearchaeota archaeon]|nr:hypothetical protein [Candidatus Woesearchaeota archaeon]